MPWIAAAIAATNELADELSTLSPAEREEFKANYAKLIAGAPGLELAAHKIKKQLLKEGAVALTYASDSGQILLEPMTLVPTRAIKNLDARTLASVRKGISQAKAGELHDLGSFAKYAKDAPRD